VNTIPPRSRGNLAKIFQPSRNKGKTWRHKRQEKFTSRDAQAKKIAAIIKLQKKVSLATELVKSLLSQQEEPQQDRSENTRPVLPKGIGVGGDHRISGRRKYVLIKPESKKKKHFAGGNKTR